MEEEEIAKGGERDHFKNWEEKREIVISLKSGKSVIPEGDKFEHQNS